LRAIFSGETLDTALNVLRSRIPASIVRKLDGSAASPYYGKLRTIVKSLLQLGATISQSREFRDLFEIILTKLAEPLEDSSLSSAEINVFLYHCCHLCDDIPSTDTHGRAYSIVKSEPTSGKILSTSVGSQHGSEIVHMNSGSTATAGGSGSISGGPLYSSRTDVLKKDWLRFVTFIRLCLLQLLFDRSIK
jgi:hypothetical protein